MFLLLVFTNALPIDDRAHNAILSAGLSPKNYLEILGVGIAGLWTLRTLLRNRVRVRILFAGHMRWFVFLCALYAVSALWSLMPAMTLFMTVELLLAGTLAQFILRLSMRPARSLLVILYICMIKCAAYTAIYLYTVGMWHRALIGALRSNPGGGIASSLLFFALFAPKLPLRSRLLHSLVAVAGILLFGSLGSFIALSAAVAYIMLTGHSRAVKAATLTLLLCAATLLLGGVPSVQSIEGFLATISGKPLADIQSATGRVDLWQEASSFLAGRPLGAGYVAGERLMVFTGDVDTSKTWDAASCHNGYLSAWMAAGPLGLVLLLLFLGSLYCALGNHGSSVWRGLLVLLMVNNLSLSSVGGQIDAITIFALALAAIPFTFHLRRTV